MANKTKVDEFQEFYGNYYASLLALAEEKRKFSESPGNVVTQAYKGVTNVPADHLSRQERGRLQNIQRLETAITAIKPEIIGKIKASLEGVLNDTDTGKLASLITHPEYMHDSQKYASLSKAAKEYAEISAIYEVQQALMTRDGIARLPSIQNAKNPEKEAKARIKAYEEKTASLIEARIRAGGKITDETRIKEIVSSLMGTVSDEYKVMILSEEYKGKEQALVTAMGNKKEIAGYLTENLTDDDKYLDFANTLQQMFNPPQQRHR